MSEPIRHHVIPQFILRGFVDEHGKLHVFDKSQPERGIEKRSPSKALAYENLNTIEEKDGTRSAELEKWYSKLESRVAPLVARISANAKEGKLPGLTHEEKNLWDNFVYHQHKRAPDTFARIGLVEGFDKDLPEFIAEYERDVRPLTEKERAEFDDPATRARLLQRATVIARGKPSEAVVRLFADRGLLVGFIDSTITSFVVGDHPFARMGPDPNLKHRQAELWFPVSSQVAVSPWGTKGAEQLLALNERQVRSVNETIAHQSNVVAARSAMLMNSLVGPIRTRRKSS